MENRQFKHLTWLLVISTSSCVFDEARDLGNDYFINGYETSTVLYKKLPSGAEKEVLLGDVSTYLYDDNFIAIRREVSPKVISHFSDHNLSEITRGGDSIQYWIVKKDKDLLIGPLSQTEYFIKRKELKLSAETNLE